MGSEDAKQWITTATPASEGKGTKCVEQWSYSYLYTTAQQKIRIPGKPLPQPRESLNWSAPLILLLHATCTA